MRSAAASSPLVARGGLARGLRRRRRRRRPRRAARRTRWSRRRPGEHERPAGPDGACAKREPRRPPARPRPQPGLQDAGRAQTSQAARAASRRATWSRAAQARAIVGAPVQEPLEAPQGPTCIYRTPRGEELHHARRAGARLRQLKRADARPARGRRSPTATALLRHARPADALRAALARPGAERRRAVRRRAQRFARQGRAAPLADRAWSVYQVSNPTAVLRGHRRLLSRAARPARASAAPSSCSGSRACSPTSPRRWSPRSCRCTWSTSAGFSPLAFGVIDGIYQGATALVAAGQRLHRRPLAAPQGGRRRPATGSRRSASSCSPTVGHARSRRSAPSCCSTAPARASAPRRATR